MQSVKQHMTGGHFRMHDHCSLRLAQADSMHGVFRVTAISEGSGIT